MSRIVERNKIRTYQRRLLTKKSKRLSSNLIMNSSAIAHLMFSKIDLSKKCKLQVKKSIFNLKFILICLESASHTKFKSFMKLAKSLQIDSKTYLNKFSQGCCKKMTIYEGNTKISLIKRPQPLCLNNIISISTKLRPRQLAQISL